MLRSLVILLSCIVVLKGYPLYLEAEAKFKAGNVLGISGNVIFSELYDGQFHIYVRLSGSLKNLDWSIHKFPSSDCSTVGSVFEETNLGEFKNKNESITGNSMLRSHTGIIGRSLLIQNAENGEKICSTILLRGPSLVKTTTLMDNNNVYGTLTLWIPKTEGIFSISEYPTVIHAKFRHGNSTMVDPQVTKGHAWHIHRKFVEADGSVDCFAAGVLIGKISTTECSYATPEFCAEGDLEAKFGPLEIPGEYLFSDPNLHFPNGLSESFVLHAQRVKISDVAGRMSCVILNDTEISLDGITSGSVAGGDIAAGSPETVGIVLGILFGVFCLCALIWLICIRKPSETNNTQNTAQMTQQTPGTSAGIQMDAQSPSTGAVRGEDGQWRAQS